MTSHISLSRLSWFSALVLLAGLAGCDRSEERSPSSPSTPPESSSESPDEESDSPPDEDDSPSTGEAWQQVDRKKLEKREQKMLERAESARKKLGSTLKKELTSAVSEKSFSGAVDFCHSRAPEIAAEVAKETDVEIGRTSHRLRNADNTPPNWAKAAVERRKAQPYVYRGPDERIGYLHPIETKGLCINCHGKRDQLAPDVADMLAKRYPEDEATGFEVGDLRGWFWVEVPKRDS
jgi:hypothetical protein